jgi:ribosomal protein L7/L12
MESKAVVQFKGMIKRLEYLEKNPKIKVLHANFKTEEIIVSVGDKAGSYKDMMARIKFVELAERLEVIKVDFESGEITINVLDHDKNEILTPGEMDEVKRGRPIVAIKSVRQRTNAGLKDAKDIVDEYREKIKQELLDKKY